MTLMKEVVVVVAVNKVDNVSVPEPVPGNSSIAPISTEEAREVAFILCEKTSTVR
jgi:hypothetical protein